MHVLLIVALVLLCASVARGQNVSHTNSSSLPDCSPGTLDSGVDARKRNETITCAMREIDTRHRGYIDKQSYETYTHRVAMQVPELLRDESKIPSYSQLLSKCDCNGDQKITPLEIYRAVRSCLAVYATVTLAHATLC